MRSMLGTHTFPQQIWRAPDELNRQTRRLALLHRLEAAVGVRGSRGSEFELDRMGWLGFEKGVRFS